MPANKKYLSPSPWFKLGKLSAAILGSLIASVTLHTAIAVWTDRDIVLPTAVYSGFMVWVGFMLISYWVPKVWQAWSILVGVILVSTMAIYLG